MSETQQIVTPVGKLQWVVVTGEGKPDLKGNLKYQASFFLKGGSEELAEMQSIIDAYWKANAPTGFKVYKSCGINHILDKPKKEGGKPTGDFLLQMKTNVTWPDGKPKKVTIKNSKGAEVQIGDTLIGNDTEGRLSGTLGIYTIKQGNSVTDAGVTIYLNGVQIVNLIEYVADDGMGALEVEDGWTGNEDGDGLDSIPVASTEGVAEPAKVEI